MISSVRLTIDRTIRRLTKHVNIQFRGGTWKGYIILVATIIILAILYIIYSSKNQEPYVHCDLRHIPNYVCKLSSSNDIDLSRTIYVITPTYDRHVQKADLTRLANTLMLIPNLHWIIVEDSLKLTSKITDFARRLQDRFGFVSITHLNSPTPVKFKLKPGDPSWRYPKGVWQRNRALDWIVNNLDEIDKNGIIYFADDDNTYDLELFEEMRKTKLISVWPVGLAGGLLVERPIVDSINSSKVNSFNSMWKKQRPFPIDMAGFAISVKLYLAKYDVKFSANEHIGYIESNFLGQLIESWNDLEPRSYDCKKILVWHTKTQPPSLHEEIKLTIPSISGMI